MLTCLCSVLCVSVCLLCWFGMLLLYLQWCGCFVVVALPNVVGLPVLLYCVAVLLPTLIFVCCVVWWCVVVFLAVLCVFVCAVVLLLFCCVVASVVVRVYCCLLACRCLVGNVVLVVGVLFCLLCCKRCVVCLFVVVLCSSVAVNAC